MSDTYGLLIDTTKCIGCKACTIACKQWNDGPTEATRNQGSYQNPPRLSAATLTNVEYRETKVDGGLVWSFTKRACMHCEHPGCVSACPVGALQKSSTGAVTYDASRCLGCRYCMMACPFGVPSFDWNKGLLEAPIIRKCVLCNDRISQGLSTACSKACPSEAIKFGQRSALLREAEMRIANNPGKYVNHVYGKTEAGGTSVLYLGRLPFEQLGLPSLSPAPVAAVSESVMSGTLPFALVWGGVLAGAYKFFQWRQKRMAPATGQKADAPPADARDGNTEDRE